jgi:hypothetical protein
MRWTLWGALYVPWLLPDFCHTSHYIFKKEVFNAKVLDRIPCCQRANDLFSLYCLDYVFDSLCRQGWINHQEAKSG